MSEADRYLKRDNGKLFYNTVHSLIMVLTRKGLKQLADANLDDASVNYVVRNYDCYDPFKQQMVKQDFVKMEIFFLSFYHLVEKQGFLDVERDDVS